MSTQKRTYRMRRRADAQAATRLRITESAVELHGTLGPARTTMAAVAERAGVQRSTLYRHFPDEEALFAACSAHFYALHPPPDIEGWGAIEDPDERLQKALAELYRWYRATGTMFDLLLRDEHVVPSVRKRFGAFHARLATACDVLMAGRRLGRPERVRARAVIGLALAFETWRGLCRDGDLDDAEAVELFAAMLDALS
jgi:AcrR family transcriptional regulator